MLGGSLKKFSISLLDAPNAWHQEVRQQSQKAPKKPIAAYPQP